MPEGCEALKLHGTASRAAATEDRRRLAASVAACKGEPVHGHPAGMLAHGPILSGTSCREQLAHARAAAPLAPPASSCMGQPALSRPPNANWITPWTPLHLEQPTQRARPCFSPLQPGAQPARGLAGRRAAGRPARTARAGSRSPSRVACSLATARCAKSRCGSPAPCLAPTNPTLHPPDAGRPARRAPG